MMGNISPADVIAMLKESSWDKACPIVTAPVSIVNTTCKKSCNTKNKIELNVEP